MSFEYQTQRYCFKWKTQTSSCYWNAASIANYWAHFGRSWIGESRGNCLVVAFVEPKHFECFVVESRIWNRSWSRWKRLAKISSCRLDNIWWYWIWLRNFNEMPHFVCQSHRSSWVKVRSQKRARFSNKARINRSRSTFGWSFTRRD